MSSIGGKGGPCGAFKTARQRGLWHCVPRMLPLLLTVLGALLAEDAVATALNCSEDFSYTKANKYTRAELGDKITLQWTPLVNAIPDCYHDNATWCFQGMYATDDKCSRITNVTKVAEFAAVDDARYAETGSYFAKVMHGSDERDLVEWTVVISIKSAITSYVCADRTTVTLPLDAPSRAPRWFSYRNATIVVTEVVDPEVTTEWARDGTLLVTRVEGANVTILDRNCTATEPFELRCSDPAAGTYTATRRTPAGNTTLASYTVSAQSDCASAAGRNDDRGIVTAVVCFVFICVIVAAVVFAGVWATTLWDGPADEPICWAMMSPVPSEDVEYRLRE